MGKGGEITRDGKERKENEHGNREKRVREREREREREKEREFGWRKREERGWGVRKCPKPLLA